MKIKHRVCVNATGGQARALLRYGIRHEDRGNGLMVFTVDEDDPSWPALASLIAGSGTSQIVLTEFTTEELAQAQQLRMGPNWHHAYPQPEEGYEKTTYDDTEKCTTCGIGLKQKAPFRLLREPKWGGRHILQLNWVMDEFFVTPGAWQGVFSPFGVGCLPVMNHKTGRPLSTAVQLQVPFSTTSVLEPGGFLRETCPECRRSKLCGAAPGRFPHVDLPPNTHMAKTPDYFGPKPGDGPVAWHEVILSGVLYKAIVSHKFRGATFDVVAAPGQPRR